MANTHDLLINNWEVYLDGTRLLGTVEATLPNVQPMEQSVKGAGIYGETSVPVIGHFQEMELSMTWRVITEDVKKILPQKYHHLELWAGTQKLDTATGEFKTVQQKAILRAVPSGINTGKFAVGELQDVETPFKCCYYKLVIDGKEIHEIDIFNAVYKVGGVDMLAEVRGAVGI